MEHMLVDCGRKRIEEGIASPTKSLVAQNYWSGLVIVLARRQKASVRGKRHRMSSADPELETIQFSTLHRIIASAIVCRYLGWQVGTAD